jgi:septal ring factor EnvC (AmiA/AmiB activator)
VSESDYERGVKEGRVNALLDEHTSRLNKINGSVERFSKSHESLAKAISVGLEKLAAEMRVMQEEARARELAVKVAADTLAKETERRRQALEVPVRNWSIRSNKAAVVYAVICVLVVLNGLYPHHL